MKIPSDVLEAYAYYVKYGHFYPRLEDYWVDDINSAENYLKRICMKNHRLGLPEFFETVHYNRNEIKLYFKLNNLPLEIKSEALLKYIEKKQFKTR